MTRTEADTNQLIESLIPYAVRVISDRAWSHGLRGDNLHEAVADGLMQLVLVVRRCQDEGLTDEEVRGRVTARLKGHAKDHLSSQQPLGYRSRGYWADAPQQESGVGEEDHPTVEDEHHAEQHDEVRQILSLSGLDGSGRLRALAELVAYEGCTVAEAARRVGLRAQDAQAALRTASVVLSRRLLARRLNEVRRGLVDYQGNLAIVR